MEKVLFVCHGNICRSPMAEFIMKKLVKDAGRECEFEIASAATSREEIGNDIYPSAKSVLRRHGIPFHSRRARQITASDLSHYDHIFVMDSNNLGNIRRMSGEIPGNVRMLMSLQGETRDVADPWYTGDFEATYNDIDSALRHWLQGWHARSSDSNPDSHFTSLAKLPKKCKMGGTNSNRESMKLNSIGDFAPQHETVPRREKRLHRKKDG